MSKRTVYFSTGEIVEATCWKSYLRRIIANHVKYADEPIRYWFRPTEEWKQVSDKYLENWKKTHPAPWSLPVGEV